MQNLFLPADSLRRMVPGAMFLLNSGTPGLYAFGTFRSVVEQVKLSCHSGVILQDEVISGILCPHSMGRHGATPLPPPCDKFQIELQGSFSSRALFAVPCVPVSLSHFCSISIFAFAQATFSGLGVPLRSYVHWWCRLHFRDICRPSLQRNPGGAVSLMTTRVPGWY